MPSTTPLHWRTCASTRMSAASLALWMFSVASPLLLTLPSTSSAQNIVHSPSASGKALLSEVGNQPTAASKLPAPLQQAITRYPVSLYANANCSACTIGRDFLQRRGIPFQEYRIDSPQEQRAASNLGVTTLPHLMIGSQALKGFDSLDWANYLTAAGYPANNVLPANYQAPAIKSVLPESVPAAVTPSQTPWLNEATPAASAADTATTTEPAPADAFRF